FPVLTVQRVSGKLHNRRYVRPPRCRRFHHTVRAAAESPRDEDAGTGKRESEIINWGRSQIQFDYVPNCISLCPKMLRNLLCHPLELLILPQKRIFFI